MPTSGLVLGYGVANEINTANAAARIELKNGTITQNTIGGLSTVTQKGTLTYERDVVNRIYIVANDTDQPLTNYAGDEDLAAGSFEVWLFSGTGGLQQVLEATLARDPQYAGFRTWSTFDDSFFVDNVVISGGASLAAVPAGRCRLTSTPALGVLSGEKIRLTYAVESELPAGSMYKISASGQAVFDQATGPAAANGEIEATVTGANREAINFLLEIRDSENQLYASANAKIRVFAYAMADSMVHPSIINTAEQLESMRRLVNYYPGSIARAGWEAMLASEYATKQYLHRPQEIVLVVPSGGNDSEDAFRSDAAAARCHALQWVVTGDPAHRDLALTILNDWGRTFRDILSTGSPDQVQLESAWALPVWLGAADILRYYNNGEAGWAESDMAVFHGFMEVLYEKAAATLYRDQNWGASASLAVMAYGAWTGDREIFLSGMNNQLLKIDRISEPDGQIAEICRDTWHPQYTVVTWGDSAELAFHQGYDDLYEKTFDGQTTPRLVIVLEYFAKLLLGKIPAPCEAGWSYNYLGEYARFDNYEVPYNHYLNRMGRTDLPVFQEMVEQHWRQQVGDDAHFLLWSRLTQGTNVLDSQGQAIPWGRGILSQYPATSSRWIQTDPWLGWLNDTSYPWVFHLDLGFFFVASTEPGSGFWGYFPRD